MGIFLKSGGGGFIAVFVNGQLESPGTKKREINKQREIEWISLICQVNIKVKSR